MLSEDISGHDEEEHIEYDFKLISCHLIIARLCGWKLYTRNCAQAVTMIRKSLRRPAVGSLFKSSLLPMKCLQSHSAQLFHWQCTFCCYNTPSCFGVGTVATIHCEVMFESSKLSWEMMEQVSLASLAWTITSWQCREEDEAVEMEALRREK